EVYQSGPTVPPVANGWGCEVGATQATKYVAGIGTSIDGAVTATVQGISASVNGSLVTLIPMATSAAAAVFTTGNSASTYGWTCGGAGTTVPLKSLPGSCRGQYAELRFNRTYPTGYLFLGGGSVRTPHAPPVVTDVAGADEARHRREQ